VAGQRLGAVMPMDFRKLLAVGTGAGIEIRRNQLYATVVRVRPSGVKLLGRAVIEGYGTRAAAEWGADYTALMKGLGASHLAASVILPRGDVIVRQIALPGVTDRDLASAVRFQIDSLHPYEEDEATHAWVRIPGTDHVLVVIARRAKIERYAALFQEAGIKISSFTCSAAALYSAIRLFGVPPEGGFVTLAGGGSEAELYGESAARPLFSASLGGLPEHAVSLAAAELRLASDAAAVPIEGLLPAPVRAPADFDLSREALPYAVALAGACPRLALAANLLPAEHRSSSSRLMYVPTAVLAALLILLVIALGAQSRYQERRYLEQLEAEIARLEPQAKTLDRVERSIDEGRGRIRLLDDFHRRTKSDLDALNELTKMLAPPAWLSEMELTRGSVSMSGEAEQAAPLLKLLDSSPLFERSEFTGPLSRIENGERFRLQVASEGAP